MAAVSISTLKVDPAGTCRPVVSADVGEVRLAPLPVVSLPATTPASSSAEPDGQQSHTTDGDHQQDDDATLDAPNAPDLASPGRISRRTQAVNDATEVQSAEWMRRAALADMRAVASSSAAAEESSASSLAGSSTSRTAGGDKTWMVFYRQKDAYQYIDKRYMKALAADKRNERVLPAASASAVPPHALQSTLVDLSNQHDRNLLKVFSEEVGAGGKRKFIVASVAEFVSRWTRNALHRRHYYEMLREDAPVHLYFDIEYKRGSSGGAAVQQAPAAASSTAAAPFSSSFSTVAAVEAAATSSGINAGVDGDLLVGVLMHRVALALNARYGIDIAWEDVVHLESSTANKFSRHLIVRLPGNAMFRSCAHAGEFVMQMVEDLRAELQAPADGAPDPELRKLLQALWIETDKVDGEPAPVPPASPTLVTQRHSTSRAGTGGAASAAAAEVTPASTRGGAAASPPSAPGWSWDEISDEQITAMLLEAEASSSGSRRSMNRTSGQLQQPAASAGFGREFIADLAVYTRNRAMRMYLATKLGKSAPLMPAACNRYGVPAAPMQAPTASISGTGGPIGSTSSLQRWLEGARPVPWLSSADADTSAAAKSGRSFVSVSPQASSAAPSPPASLIPIIQEGSKQWEQQMWCAGLITDALPPLWMSRMQAAGSSADGDATDDAHAADRATAEAVTVQSPPIVKAGSPSDELSRMADVSMREAETRRQRSEYNPPVHPVRGFKLLYCWPRDGRKLAVQDNDDADEHSGAMSNAHDADAYQRPLASRVGRFGGSSSTHNRKSWSHGGGTGDGGGYESSSSSVILRATGTGTSSHPALAPARHFEGGSSPPPFPNLALWICGVASGPVEPSMWVRFGQLAAVPSPPSSTASSGADASSSALQQRVPSTIRGWAAKIRDLTFEFQAAKATGPSSQLPPATAASGPGQGSAPVCPECQQDGAGEGGESSLVRCAACDDAYHPECVAAPNPPSTSDPWICPTCDDIRSSFNDHYGDSLQDFVSKRKDEMRRRRRSSAIPGPSTTAPIVTTRVVRVLASVTYHIGGSRWCHRIGRHHKGNHVMWTVDLEAGTAHQACFDASCKGYRSPPIAVPAEVMPDQAPPGGRLKL